MKHIGEILKKRPPVKKAAKRRKQGKTGVATRKVVISAMEQYASQNRFILIVLKGKVTKKKKKVEGRPLVVTQDVVKKLEDAFCYDATVEEACLSAGISRQTYYNFLKEYPTFVDRVEDLRQAPYLVLRKKVMQVGEHDADMGLKILERKKKGEFSTRTEVAHSGEVVNRHHVDPEQAALIRSAMGNFAKKIAKDAAAKK